MFNQKLKRDFYERTNHVIKMWHGHNCTFCVGAAGKCLHP